MIGIVRTLCRGAFAVLPALMSAIPASAADNVLAILQPEPGMEARSTALFITGAEGWTPEHALRAGRLTEMHTLVIAVDGPGLLDTAGGCRALGAPLAALADRVQAETGSLARMPVLTALADGADLALAAAEAAPDRFKGLATERFGSVPGPCAVALTGKAPVRWYDIVAPGTASQVAHLAGVRVLEAGEDPRKAFYRGYLAVAGADSALDTHTMAAGDLANLPLTLHHEPSASATDTYAIFLSGDGGWAKFDEEVSSRLAAAGVPVVGISSLRYMWREKQPGQIAADFARIDRHYRQEFSSDRVLLIGFSLGANTLPFAAPELPAEMQARLAGVGLIAPETLTGFEIVMGGWLGRATGATEVAPAIDALDGVLPGDRVACLHGTAETMSACPVSALAEMRQAAFEGGHHLGKDYDRIAATLMALVPGQGTD